MRVSARIAQALFESIDTVLSPAPGSELFLFGSRVDDKKKGGDIDLLLVTDEATKRKSGPLRLELKAALRAAAKDQRVDLSVVNEPELLTDPFFSSIGERVSLGKW
jgi:predicted nucleotidyltransferase